MKHPAIRGALRALTLAGLICAGGAAQAWWNEDWSTRRQLVVDATLTGANLSAPIADVPVLVRLHSGNLPGFETLAPEGADLRFLENDTRALPYHVEKFDAEAGIALAWVRLAQVAPTPGGGTLHLYSGNPEAKPAADPAGTYDAAQALVYHFAEPAGPPRDTTANGLHARASGALPLVAGWLGAAAEFRGDGRIETDAAPALSFDPAKGLTFSAWVRVEDAQQGAVIAALAGNADTLELTVTGSALAVRVDGEQKATATLQPGKWQHLALTLLGTTFTLFVDGEQVAGVEAPFAASPLALALGGGADGRFFKGAIDEVGIATVARSADWLRFLFRSQSPDFAVTEFGGTEAREAAAGAHAGHFAIIFQYVFGRTEAVIEQAVIGICVLMAAIAALVMLAKAIAIGRARRGNRRFLDAYESALVEAPDALDRFADAEDEFGEAPLFRIYQAGLRQVRARLARQPDTARLDQKSVDAIRTNLDAALAREGQRLNALLVLLTIAISGGPFIGLLGTVVGVMVTFAAIASTGDVNIAAIAPGMAAALLATVAGLGVAIPSLFGYNYLSARARDTGVDHRVFADELVARINEVHGV